MSSASLAPDSPRKAVNTWLIFSESPSRITMSCSLKVYPLFLPELADQDHAGHGVERVEHAVTVDRHGLEGRDPAGPAVEEKFHVLERRDVGKVALVVLDHVRDLVDVVVVLAEVLFQVAEAFDVLAQPFPLRVCHEDEPVAPAQDELARHVVVDLPRHRIQLELRREAADGQRRSEEHTSELQ